MSCKTLSCLLSRVCGLHVPQRPCSLFGMYVFSRRRYSRSLVWMYDLPDAWTVDLLCWPSQLKSWVAGDERLWEAGFVCELSILGITVVCLAYLISDSCRYADVWDGQTIVYDRSDWTCTTIPCQHHLLASWGLEWSKVIDSEVTIQYPVSWQWDCLVLIDISLKCHIHS